MQYIGNNRVKDVYIGSNKVIGTICYENVSNDPVVLHTNYTPGLSFSSTSGGVAVAGYDYTYANINNVIVPDRVYSNVSSPGVYDVKSIGIGAFYSKPITSIELGQNITAIGQSAFYNCSQLTSIPIPTSTVSISQSAFQSSGLTSLTIPNSVTTLEGSLCENCAALTSAVIGSNVVSIPHSAFENCSNLSSVTFNGSNVSSIGSDAFKNCSSLYDISLPNSVTSIGSYVFSGCNHLSNINIPNNVTEIDVATFSYCSNLSAVTLPSNLTRIRSSAFWGCGRLNELTFPNTSSKWSNIWYNAGTNWDYNTGNYVVICNDNNAVGKTGACYALTQGTYIVDSFIGYAQDIIIRSTIDGKNVTSIGEHAFRNHSSLTSITIPNSITSIVYQAFYNCSSLTNITFGENSQLTSIGYEAFMRCSNLPSITIPHSVTNIENLAFRYCTNLSTIYINKPQGSISGAPWGAPNAQVIWQG